MSSMDRRQLLKSLASAPMAAVAINWTEAEAHAASAAAQAARQTAQASTPTVGQPFWHTP